MEDPTQGGLKAVAAYFAWLTGAVAGVALWALIGAATGLLLFALFFAVVFMLAG